VHLPIMSGIHAALGGLAPPILVLFVAAGLTVVLALLLEIIVTRPAQTLGKRFSEWMCERDRAERALTRIAA
jgi:peptidoglycan/LPS O-acetylase OafA/YrhL